MDDYKQRKQEQLQLQEMRWKKWKAEQDEAKARAQEFQQFWIKKKEEQITLQREKDFLEALDKVGRAGYKGKFGSYEVPGGMILKLTALQLQVEQGNYNQSEHPCKEDWRKLEGMTRIDAQREYIKLANKVLTKYGWNPPPGWT